MTHNHNVLDMDSIYIIDPITRTIKNESSSKAMIMQNDHNSERFSFEMPRYIEGHDMSLCDKVEVHYLNISSNKRLQNSGLYTVTDLNPTDEKVKFSWLISENATRLIGTLNFLICFCCTNNGTITYSWHTAIHEGIPVSRGIDAGSMFPSEYVDIIAQWEDTVISKLSNDIDLELKRWETTYAANWQKQIATERERIDAFTSLAEGSTTGDAELIDARIGTDGVAYNNLGSAVRSQISRITEATEHINNDGLTYLSGKFIHGVIDGTGAEFAGDKRVKSSSMIRYDRDITITPTEGFRFAIHFYKSDGTYLSESGWQTKAYIVEAGTLFKVVIARVTEDAFEVADINEFVNKLTITTAISDNIKSVETLKNAQELHESSDVHLRSIITSNNLADPSQMIDGGYYAYNDGTWMSRSDIATTGLIPCESGQHYCCGVSLTSVRGGACSFWNSGGEYVSGINIVDGTTGFDIPDNPEIKYFRMSFYKGEKYLYRVNLNELKEYDEFNVVYSFDKEIATPKFDSAYKDNILYYSSTYKDDVAILHKRSENIGTSYIVTIINKEKYDGTKTQVTISGTSAKALGDGSNTNVSTFANRNKAVGYLHVINGGIFLTNGEADGITIMNGAILKNTGVEQFEMEQYVLGITRNGEFKCYINESAENILADGSVYALTGFVPLIQDGMAVDDSVLSVCPHYNVRHPRQIIGTLADGNYFTFCCDGRTEGENGMTLAECIDTLMNDLNVTFAFNLDGGGSTQSIVGQKLINRLIDGRTVPNVITFK